MAQPRSPRNGAYWSDCSKGIFDNTDLAPPVDQRQVESHIRHLSRRLTRQKLTGSRAKTIHLAQAHLPHCAHAR